MCEWGVSPGFQLIRTAEVDWQKKNKKNEVKFCMLLVMFLEII